MSIRTNMLVWLFVGAVISVPAWAAHKDTALATFDHPMTIDGTQIQAGTYQFKAIPNDTKVQILRNDSQKVVATVEGRWIALSSKPSQTQVLTNRDQVQEIDFRSQEQALQFPGNASHTASGKD